MFSYEHCSLFSHNREKITEHPLTDTILIPTTTVVVIHSSNMHYTQTIIKDYNWIIFFFVRNSWCFDFLAVIECYIILAILYCTLNARGP